MNGRTLVLVVLALFITGVTVMLVKNRAQPPEPTGTRIMVAADEIPVGTFIRADKDVTWAPWAAREIAPSFITPEAHKIEEFNGSVARRTIQAGEPVTSDSVIRVNEGGFMPAVLAPGMRAVSIAVNSTSGNAGFVFPDDKVDLIVTHRIPSNTNGGQDTLASETFVKNVRVLAIDQMVHNSDNKAVVAKTITLEVTPKQAEMINVANGIGTITVSLRSLAPSKTAASTGTAPVSNELPVTGAATTDNPDINFSTNTDVSRLMGDKGVTQTKVNVYHGSTTEQLNFR